ncbi:alkaline phosphatase family protein [Burkholderia vietnamiensis]|uniref:alkaline phosphatase family protein n=1 Tax=Burkholderia vietnamiensis TaxID=60552 RepID=UPI0020129FA5|nr:alkaline phosphatase family protein [Burkholderia vietnamiensis]
MSAIDKIKRLFVLMLENRSYDNLFGWSDFRGWTPGGVATQADGLVGKPLFSNAETVGATGNRYTLGMGAPFRLAFDPGHEFSDTLVQMCGAANAASYLSLVAKDGVELAGGQYPPLAASANDLGFATDMSLHGYDVATAMRCFTPDQLPVLNFLAQQFTVCDRWFAPMPGPTWPNRFFALAGTSWGLDHSPSNATTVASNLFDGAKFGTGSDSLLTCLTPPEWLVAYGDMPQSWALRGVDAHPTRFLHHVDFVNAVKGGRLEDARFIFIEPTYDPIGSFRNGESMHPCGDVRNGEALVERMYNAILESPYWEECIFLIVFDEHGGFFDHVIPTPDNISGMQVLKPATPTALTQRGFRFDRYGVRVPAIIVSPYVKQATIDHAFYDHVSIAKTLALITRRTVVPFLNGPRFAGAADFSSVLTLSQPRKASDIHACPSALPVAPPASAVTINRAATAFNNLNWPMQSMYGGA